MFVGIVIALVVISFLWALWSLRSILKNTTLIARTKKDLSKHRVVFHYTGKGQDSSSGSASAPVSTTGSASREG